MSRHVVLATLLSMFVAPTPTSAATCPDETALRSLKTEHWPSLYRQGDVEGLRALLHDEFRVVDAGGNVSTKADELDWLARNTYVAREFRYDITSIQCEGPLAVIIGTGSMLDDADPAGKQRSSYVSSNVLIKDQGRWRAILSHVSGIKSPASPPTP